MDIFEVAGQIAESSISVLLAIVVIYWYRSDSKERISNAEGSTQKALQSAELERADKLLMIETVRSNTQVMTELLVVTQSILHRIDTVEAYERK